MNSFEDGFLSPEQAETVIIVRQRYQLWRDLVLEVNRIAVRCQHELIVHTENTLEVYGAVLFARTISTVQASVILLEQGLLPQARTVLRSAMESFFALSAIATKPEMVDRLVEAHEAEQRRVARNSGQWKHPELQTIAKKSLKISEKFLNSSAREVSAFDLAVVGGNEDWYRTVYNVFSWSAHATSQDLERHLVLGQERDIDELRNEPELDGLESTWSCAVELLTKSVRSIAVLFPACPADLVATGEKRHIELMDELVSRTQKPEAAPA